MNKQYEINFNGSFALTILIIQWQNSLSKLLIKYSVGDVF
jgi:hypothetical protein